MQRRLYPLITTLLVIGIAVPALAQDRATPAQIKRWVSELSSPKYAARLAATQALLAAGEPALAPLKALLEDPPDLEARKRAEDLVEKIERRLRWERIKGGASVGGIQARVRTTRDVYTSGDPVRFELELLNVGTKTTACLTLDVLDATLPDGRIEHGGKATGILTIRRVGVERKLKWATQMARGAPAKPVELAPKKRVARSMTPRDLIMYKRSQVGPLPPGTYELSFRMYTRTLGGQKADLKSNVMRFTIRKSQPKKGSR